MPPARAGLTFRQDYYDDPQGWAALKTLLIDIFDVDISPLDHLGGHDRTSFPSAYFDADGRCIANLSGFSMPLIVNGRSVKAAGWQSGAVRPDYRGQGLFRDLIRITLDRCESQGFEAIVLYTSKPGLYEPYGFRIVPQYTFSRQTPKALGAPRKARDICIDTDVGLLRGLLANRSPVSRRFAVADQAKMFLLNTYLADDMKLSLLDDEIVIAWRLTKAGVFELLDIVGQRIPALGEIIAALAISPVSVTAYVPPDLLSWSAEPVMDNGSTVFMMRADDALFPTEPSCLSPMAEF